MKHFFLIGKPIGHSFSANYFNEKFEREGIDARYDLRELDSIEELPSVIKEYGEDLIGFNITAPYKLAVILYLDALTSEAKRAGAVNCVRRNRNGELIGHNTDVAGFLALLEKNLPRPAGVKKALILGGGGVVGAVMTALEKRGFTYSVAMREPSKFKEAHPGFDPEVKEFSKLTMDDILDVDIIINCTPLGMEPNVKSAPPILYEYIQPRHVCLDLVYNPRETVFSKICAAHGAKTATGLLMLTAQAEEGWKFWDEII